MVFFRKAIRSLESSSITTPWLARDFGASLKSTSVVPHLGLLGMEQTREEPEAATELLRTPLLRPRLADPTLPPCSLPRVLQARRALDRGAATTSAAASGSSLIAVFELVAVAVSSMGRRVLMISTGGWLDSGDGRPGFDDGGSIPATGGAISAADGPSDMAWAA